MNKRQAKREACWRAAGALQSVLEHGWEELDERFPNPVDRQRLGDAFQELIEELERRGHV